MPSGMLLRFFGACVGAPAVQHLPVVPADAEQGIFHPCCTRSRLVIWLQRADSLCLPASVSLPLSLAPCSAWHLPANETPMLDMF